jgi:hypothetical protein
MAKLPLSRFRIALNVSLMNDLERMGLIAGIQKVATSSSLMKVPAIAASYSALVTKGAAFQTSSALVSADEKQLRLDETSRDLARSTADAELVTLKTLVSQNAASASDVAGMGFTELPSVAAAQQNAPAVPGPILVKIGKVQGAARVGIGAAGVLRGTTVAEVSPDPITATSWTLMPGAGKQRKLSGYASGTRLWVRFAAVKYGQQSAWSTPVMLTIP